MLEKEIINKIIDLLSQIENEPRNKKRIVKLLEDFVNLIPQKDCFWDSQEGHSLSEFNYELAYYQPNRWIRLVNIGLYGDEKLMLMVKELLINLKGGERDCASRKADGNK